MKAENANGNKEESIMKKIIRFSAITAALLVSVSCLEENFEQPVKPAKPGDGIVFNAFASFESATPNTKTVYGNLGDSDGDKINDYQEVLWVNNDPIQIACAAGVEGRDIAEYVVRVPENNTADTGEDGKVIDGSDKGVVVRPANSNSGLQWGDPEETHTFYAVYPSPSLLSSTSTTFNRPQLVTSNMFNGEIEGYLPMQQTPENIDNLDENGNKSEYNKGNYQYEFTPNMDYAYMVAKKTVVAQNNTFSGKGVDLIFRPVVTAVQVHLKPGDIDQTAGTMIMNSVSLSSSSQLSGHFTCKFPEIDEEDKIGNPKVTCTPSQNINNSVIINLPDDIVFNTSSKSYLNAGLTLTFFILPNSATNITDLKLNVTYTMVKSNTSITDIKSLTLGRDVAAHKKHFYKNITLPNISGDVTGADWISRIDDEVLLSQLSIPTAGNVGSYAYQGDAENDSRYYKEQVIDDENGSGSIIDELWQLGVRGFEIVSSYNNNTGSPSTTVTNLGSCRIVCNGTKISNLTVKNLVDAIIDQLDYKEEGEYLYKDEFALIIFTYQSCKDQRAEVNDATGDSWWDQPTPRYRTGPERYIEALADYLDDDPKAKDRVIAYSPDLKIKDLRTGVGGQNKICLVGKISQEGEDDRTTISKVTIPSYLTYIEGWGSIKDRWNRRFGNEYAAWIRDNGSRPDGTTDETANRKYYANLKHVENNLYGVSSSSNGSITPTVEQRKYPERDYDFTYPTSTSYPAWAQEWARVSDGSIGKSDLTDGNLANLIASDGSKSLYISWPESFSEKYEHILDAFDKSKNYILGGSLMTIINAINGYFITTQDDSMGPFMYPLGASGSATHIFDYDSSTDNADTYSYTFDWNNEAVAGAAGGYRDTNGGNYRAYNSRMNKHVYDYIQKEISDMNAGPMGIVIMDYIGAAEDQVDSFGAETYSNYTFSAASVKEVADACQRLPGLIWQSNFYFPLRTDVPVTPPHEGGDGSGNDGNPVQSTTDASYEGEFQPLTSWE